MLCTFLTQLQSHPLILNSPRDERIIKNLRSVFKRQRKIYKGWHTQNTQQHPQPRKDSAIGIASCRNSIHQQQEKDVTNNTWTARVRRSIKRSISSHHQPDPAAISDPVAAAATAAAILTSTCSLPIVNNPHHLDNTTNDTKSFFSPHRASFQYMTYRSIVLKYRSEIVAQQFCLIEQAMLQKVTWDELVELRWRKRSSKRQSFVIDLATLEEEENSIGVERLIGFFNMVCTYIHTHMIHSKNPFIDLSMGCI